MQHVSPMFDYKRRHDNVARYVHCNCVGRPKWNGQISGTNTLQSKWYKIQVLWDFSVQCDRMVEARRPDIIFVDKQAKVAKIINIVIPGDARVKTKNWRK